MIPSAYLSESINNVGMKLWNLIPSPVSPNISVSTINKTTKKYTISKLNFQSRKATVSNFFIVDKIQVNNEASSVIYRKYFLDLARILKINYEFCTSKFTSNHDFQHYIQLSTSVSSHLTLPTNRNYFFFGSIRTKLFVENFWMTSVFVCDTRN